MHQWNTHLSTVSATNRLAVAIADELPCFMHATVTKHSDDTEDVFTSHLLFVDRPGTHDRQD